MKSRTVVTRICCLSAIALIASSVLFLMWLWFQPDGTGEYRTSLDGRYTASIGNYVRGTLHGRESYVEMTVEEVATKTVVWRIEYAARKDEAPDDGDRSHAPFISWASDSSTVAFPVGGDRDIVVSVK